LLFFLLVLAREIATHDIVGLDGVFKLTIYGYVLWAIVFAYQYGPGCFHDESDISEKMKPVKKERKKIKK
jgi:hypothetical protein